MWTVWILGDGVTVLNKAANCALRDFTQAFFTFAKPYRFMVHSKFNFVFCCVAPRAPPVYVPVLVRSVSIPAATQLRRCANSTLADRRFNFCDGVNLLPSALNVASRIQ
jgi:hypothetical protein